MNKDEGCVHCPINEKATKPYDKMKHLKFPDDMTRKLLEKTAEAEKTKVDCVVCKSLRQLVEGLKLA